MYTRITASVTHTHIKVRAEFETWYSIYRFQGGQGVLLPATPTLGFLEIGFPCIIMGIAPWLNLLLYHIIAGKFRGRKLSWNVKLITYIGVACLKFRGENFRCKIVKFVKVFSLESFPLYGMCLPPPLERNPEINPARV